MGTGTNKWYSNISILLVVLVSCLGVGMAGLMLLLVPRPSDVLRATMRRMATAKTFHVETDVNWRGTAGPAGFKKDELFHLSTQGDIDRNDPEKPRSTQQFSIEDHDQKIVGEYRRAGEVRLFRLSDIPEQIGGVSFASLKNSWLRFDFDTIANRFDLPVIGGGRRDLTLIESNSLTKALISTPFVVVDTYVNTEQLDGDPVFHYKVSFEPLFIKDIILRVESAKLGRDLTEKEKAVIETYFANTVVEPGEAWIGTRNDTLYRLRLRLRYDDGKRTGVLDVSMAFSRLDQPLSLTTPTDGVIDATPIALSLLPGLSGRLPLAADGSLSRGTSDATDRSGGLPNQQPGISTGDTDGDGLSNVLESFYGSNANDPDSDDDGVSDGAEIEHGQSPTGPGLLFDFTGGRFQ